MRAPVYRNIDTTSTVLGLAMPYEAGSVGIIAVLGMAWAPPLPTVLVTLTVYVALRIAGRGKPPGYLQDLLPFLVRRAGTAGRFSAVARASKQPRFAFAPYLSRDIPTHKETL